MAIFYASQSNFLFYGACSFISLCPFTPKGWYFYIFLLLYSFFLPEVTFKWVSINEWNRISLHSRCFKGSRNTNRNAIQNFPFMKIETHLLYKYLTCIYISKRTKKWTFMENGQIEFQQLSSLLNLNFSSSFCSRAGTHRAGWETRFKILTTYPLATVATLLHRTETPNINILNLQVLVWNIFNSCSTNTKEWRRSKELMLITHYNAKCARKLKTPSLVVALLSRLLWKSRERGKGSVSRGARRGIRVRDDESLIVSVP